MMIKITNLIKRYGDSVILDNASYTFPQRGLVCLLGASGGGKTTLLNLLAGFDTNYEGDISVGETHLQELDTTQLCAYRRDNIGFIFQNYHLLSGYTVLENVLLSCGLTEETEDYKKKALELLKKLEIDSKAEEKIENLSGGQKQRVAIARALLNNPQIIFADEPTGALDRTTSTDIMTLLKNLSETRLVVVITHDNKITDFADEVIAVKECKIVIEKERQKELELLSESKTLLARKKASKKSMAPRAYKNFRIHLKRYLAVSFAISIGMLAFLFSLSFGNVINRSIDEFKEKNTAFANGYIKGVDSGNVLSFLKENEHIDQAYYQYTLKDVELSKDGVSEKIAEKIPMPKTGEGVSYGVMPRKGNNEISLTPSLAKKFASDIKTLIGKKITLSFEEKTYTLTVSGIYNAGYDDFFVSSDVEQELYKNSSGENYSISYDVKEFEDILKVDNILKLRGVEPQNASKEVSALQDTFDGLNKLFSIVSILILATSLFICIILLVKLQGSRYREVGLLSALGFSRKNVSAIIIGENLLISGLAALLNLIMLSCAALIGTITSIPFLVTGLQIALCVAATFIIILLTSGIASLKLIRSEPADALRK